MQFTSPILRYLIITDDAGNPVVSIGPGSSILVEGDVYYWRVYINDTAEPFVGWGLKTDLDPGGTGDKFSQTLNVDSLGNYSLDTYNNSGHTWLRQFSDYIVMFSDTTRAVAFVSSRGYLYVVKGSNGDPYEDGFEDWNGVVFQNGWANGGGNNETAGYKLTPDGWLAFKGTIIGGTKTDGTTIFTLPPAYRPTKDKVLGMALISAGATQPNVQLRINAASGNVTCFGISATTTGNLSMEGQRCAMDT